MAALRGILDSSAIMAQKRSLPRICIALGLPDVPTLLDHARREAEAGEIFLEFRLDFLNQPVKGAAAIRGFLEQFPEVIILATCRRHQNRGRFNGSIEEQLAVLDLAIQSGAHAIDIEIESAEAAPEKLHQFSGRAHVIVSYHNFETTPPLDPIVNRMTRIPADAYKVVTTARKPSDNARILAVAKSARAPANDRTGHGRTRLSHTRALARVRRRVYLRGAHACAGHRGGTGQRSLAAPHLSSR